jgi:hypothetical protein
MALRQKRQFRAFDLPEFVAAVLIAAAIVPTTFWLQGLSGAAYRCVDGVVVACDIQPTSDSGKKITLTYRYAVGTETYTQTWTGLWPETGSPNALPPGKLDVLRQKDYPLTVYYDSDNPADGHLHIEDRGFERIYGGLSLGMCGVAVLYCAVAYPAWRTLK